MDKLAALRAFTRVVELERFSAAARDLGVSNAWMSKTIQALEAELGTPLLVRTTRQLHLTDTGRDYYARALAILEAVDEADALASQRGAGLRGTLRISAPMSLGLTDLNARLLRFARAQPSLTIDLRLDDGYVDLVEGGFDLALRGGEDLPDSTLRVRTLAELPRVLCASPAFLGGIAAPGHPRELEALPLLHYTLSRGRRGWVFARDGAEVEVDVRGPYRVNSSIALREAAVAGHGIALLPLFVVREALEAGTLVRVLPEWEVAAARLFAVVPAHRERAGKVRAVVEFLAREYAGE